MLYEVITGAIPFPDDRSHRPDLSKRVLYSYIILNDAVTGAFEVYFESFTVGRPINLLSSSVLTAGNCDFVSGT